MVSNSIDIVVCHFWKTDDVFVVYWPWVVIVTQSAKQRDKKGSPVQVMPMSRVKTEPGLVQSLDYSRMPMSAHAMSGASGHLLSGVPLENGQLAMGKGRPVQGMPVLGTNLAGMSLKLGIPIHHKFALLICFFVTHLLQVLLVGTGLQEVLTLRINIEQGVKDCNELLIWFVMCNRSSRKPSTAITWRRFSYLTFDRYFPLFIK